MRNIKKNKAKQEAKKAKEKQEEKQYVYHEFQGLKGSYGRIWDRKGHRWL